MLQYWFIDWHICTELAKNNHYLVYSFNYIRVSRAQRVQS